MPTSQNGWHAAPDLPRRTLVVRGVEFVGGIVDNDNVETVLGYVLGEFHDRVEPLRNPGCWGFAYRANANNPNALSNHSSGTAVDANAPAHPNGVPTQQTFTLPQIAEVHRILGEVDYVIRWGGDYTVTPDAMHFEVNADRERLAAVADRLRQGDAMTPAQEKKLDELVAAVRSLSDALEKANDREAARDQRDRDRTKRVIGLVRSNKATTEDILAALADQEA